MTAQRQLFLASLLMVSMVPACSKTENDKGRGNNQEPRSGLNPRQKPPGKYPVGPLVAGDNAPPLEAQGWLNGPCPALGADGPKLIVVDLWALW